jgi:hypothetical protein
VGHLVLTLWTKTFCKKARQLPRNTTPLNAWQNCDWLIGTYISTTGPDIEFLSSASGSHEKSSLLVKLLNVCSELLYDAPFPRYLASRFILELINFDVGIKMPQNIRPLGLPLTKPKFFLNFISNPRSLQCSKSIKPNWKKWQTFLEISHTMFHAQDYHRSETIKTCSKMFC